MSTQHPPGSKLGQFAAGVLPPAESASIAAHLLEGCQECRQQLESEGASASLPAKDDLSARLNTIQNDLFSARATAAAAAAQLLERPVSQSRLLVLNSQRYRTWAVAEALLEASWDVRADDPRRMKELAGLAIEAIEAYRNGEARPDEMELLADLEARGYGYLANSHRILFEFDDAEANFSKAYLALEAGSGDPMELAKLLTVENTFFLFTERYEACARHQDRLEGIYQRLGDRHALGQVEVDRGLLAERQDRPEDALHHYSVALELLDPEVDPRWILAARHNMILVLNDLGRPRDAYRELETLRPMYEELGDRVPQLKLLQLEGEIAGSLERFDVGERCLQEARQGFLELDMAYYAAESTLQLAVLYLNCGRYSEVRELGEMIIPVLQCHGLSTIATAALLVVRTAAVQERLTVGVVHEALVALESAAERA